MAMLLLAIPLLIVFYIVTQSGKRVMRDPLARVRSDEAIYQSVMQPYLGGAENGPLYCPGCKTYEDLTIFAGDRPAMDRAVTVWYQDHKPHFLPADKHPLESDAPAT